MGSVRHKSYTKPLPEGAEIIDRKGERVARWRDAKGKIKTAPVTTGVNGGDRLLLESRAYYAKYRDAAGIIVEKPTQCRDEQAARQILADWEKQVERIKAGVVTTQELAIASRMSHPIGRHIADYVRTLTGSASHPKDTTRYLKQLAAACEWKSLGDMRRDDLELWLADQAVTEEPRSARSRNAFQTAAVSFAGWCVTSKRLGANPFARMSKADVDLDRRLVRRSLSAAEVERIAEAAEKAPRRPAELAEGQGRPKGHRPAERLTPTQRALLWRVMAGTGLRLKETRLLAIGDLSLEGDRPGIDLPATITKAKRADYLPLRADLADALRRHTAGRKALAPVFSIPTDILRRFKADCKRAGIPLADERGRVVDIHALRMSFIDGLVKAGVPPAIVQQLARHADITTTMKYYTDIRRYDLHAAIATVKRGDVPGEAARLRATGTDGATDPRLALQLAPNQCKPGQTGSIAGKINENSGPSQE